MTEGMCFALLSSLQLPRYNSNAFLSFTAIQQALQMRQRCPAGRGKRGTQFSSDQPRLAHLVTLPVSHPVNAPGLDALVGGRRLGPLAAGGGLLPCTHRQRSGGRAVRGLQDAAAMAPAGLSWATGVAAAAELVAAAAAQLQTHRC
jgi:hypothetical protein